MQKSHLCKKKKILTIITHILLRNCYEIWFRDLYLQFFLKKYLYTTPQLFLEECKAAILYSIASCNIFINFFPLHFYKLHPKIFQVTILTSHLNLYTLTHYLIYYLLYIYVKKEKNIENLKIFYSIIIFTLFTSNFSMILYIYDIWVTRKQNRHFELYYSLLDCKGLV